MTQKKKLTHLDTRGNARMVDVSTKDVTVRTAIASGTIHMAAATQRLLRSGKTKKGDVLAVARIAGIQAAKRTHELIPLCHALALSSVNVEFGYSGRTALTLRATVRCEGKTGVEMEALTAVSIASLTVYDMLKAVDRGITISGIALEEKTGGRSGSWKRK